MPRVVRQSGEIEALIFTLRGQRVLLDRDLAALYGVTTKSLKQAVRRNIARFPIDFMFALTLEETRNLRSKIVTSSGGYGGARHASFAFTEHGVAMLSSVLRSPRAVAVNIEVIRAFIRLRRLQRQQGDLSKRIDELEAKYDATFKSVFDAIRELMRPAPA